MALAVPSSLPTGNRFQLSIDSNKVFSIRDATGTKEVFNISAFLRTAEVKKQIEQEVDVDDAEYQPAARGRAPLTTELADVIRPDSNFLQPPTWNYSLSKTASNRPLVALAPHADARYQNIPFKRSKVFMFYPSSTGQAPPTPSKQSQHAGVLVSDARVKFTSWSYNTTAKKYAFQLPSLPSDLEQSFLNAPPTHPHLHHSPPSSPPQQTHSLATPQPLLPSLSSAPIGTAAGLAAVLGTSVPAKPASPASPTPTGVNSPPVGAVEITAWAFTAWVADKQSAQLPLPTQPNAPRTFSFGLDNRPAVEFAFLGTFTYVIPPLEHKEPEPEFPTENLKNTAFQNAQSLTPTRYDLMSALLPVGVPPGGPGPAFPNMPNGMLSSPGLDRGGTPSATSLSAGDRAEELQWKFTQSFGDDNSSDDDLVTAMSFDHQGHYLAVGDKAGRICIFEAHPPVHTPSGCDYVDFKFYTEFQSHGPEFDCLKSLEIEERISMLRWLKQTNSGGRFLLSTNDKTIKLWKVHEKKFYEPMAYVDPSNLRLPQLPPSRILRTATCKRVFGNVHQYHINSISINSDGATFMSADDLRVYVWSLEDNRECFNVVDVKPPDLQELNEVITTSTFHPSQCNTLMYGTSRGNIRLVDFRTNAICDRYARQFHHENPHPPPQDQNFFTEIISSISDCKFTEDGRYIMSRDYLTLKIWDINGRDDRPVSIVPVHDYLQPYLSDLYENDCIFDKFQCHANRAGTRYLTGSYNNNFIIYDAIRGSVCTIEAKDTEPAGPQPANETPDVEMMDFAKKSLHLSWHPSEEVIAVAGMNKIYIYQAAISRPHL